MAQYSEWPPRRSCAEIAEGVRYTAGTPGAAFVVMALLRSVILFVANTSVVVPLGLYALVFMPRRDRRQLAARPEPPAVP